MYASTECVTNSMIDVPVKTAYQNHRRRNLAELSRERPTKKSSGTNYEMMNQTSLPLGGPTQRPTTGIGLGKIQGTTDTRTDNQAYVLCDNPQGNEQCASNDEEHNKH